MKKITKETYINWYKEMLFWRKFEDKLAALYIQQKVRGFLHLYNGQEAVLAGALHAMGENDKMITAYRNHVQPIGLGEDPKRVMAELLGKDTFEGSETFKLKLTKKPVLVDGKEEENNEIFYFEQGTTDELFSLQQ